MQFLIANTRKSKREIDVNKVLLSEFHRNKPALVQDEHRFFVGGNSCSVDCDDSYPNFVLSRSTLGRKWTSEFVSRKSSEELCKRFIGKSNAMSISAGGKKVSINTGAGNDSLFMAGGKVKASLGIGNDKISFNGAQKADVKLGGGEDIVVFGGCKKIAISDYKAGEDIIHLNQSNTGDISSTIEWTFNAPANQLELSLLSVNKHGTWSIESSMRLNGLKHPGDITFSGVQPTLIDITDDI